MNGTKEIMQSVLKVSYRLRVAHLIVKVAHLTVQVPHLAARGSRLAARGSRSTTGASRLALVLTMVLWAGSMATARLSHGSGFKVSDHSPHRLLYVAVPGIRDELEHGGHGVLVFDIDHGHRFIKRIPMPGLDAQGKPMNVKGICACAATHRLYVSTLQTLICVDLITDQVVWERHYQGGCDRMAIAPNGKVIYLPSLEGTHWNVVKASTGAIIKQVVTNSGAHNTVCGPDGRAVYLAGLKSKLLNILDPRTNTVSRTVGPFSNVIRPFTINGAQTRCFVNVNELLGFEVGDLTTGKVLYQVTVQGFKKGPTKRHGCPSHGIGLTPDERELWLNDSFNSRIHIFDATVTPPRQVSSIPVRDQPGWITFSNDGRTAYPSTGDVIDVKTHRIVAQLQDEHGQAVQSEKLLEIDFKGSRPVHAGDQFGLGRQLGLGRLP